MLQVDDLSLLERGQPVVLTIGTFDGVHRGHQWLVRQVIDRARALGYHSMVLSFDPPPSVVLRPGSRLLTDGTEKARIMAALGPTVLALLPFSRERSQVTAARFLADILEHTNLAEVWVGGDFAFGHNREGTVDWLIKNGQRNGFAVHVVPRQPLHGVPISSTHVRSLVEGGDVARAAEFLGHYFSVAGVVVEGHGRGRDLGFPTANVEHGSTQLLPAAGIYAAHLRVDGQTLPAAVSVGYNVVFGGDRLVVEAFVLDWTGDLRGRRVAVDFVERIRDERNFESVEALVAQMHRDIEAVRAALAGAWEPGELLLEP